MNKFTSAFLVVIGGSAVMWFFLSPMEQHDIIQGCLGVIMLVQGIYCVVQSPDHWCNFDWNDNV